MIKRFIVIVCISFVFSCESTSLYDCVGISVYTNNRFININLDEPIVEKERWKYEEALRRVQEVLTIENDSFSLGRTTSEDLNMNADLFDAFKIFFENIPVTDNLYNSFVFPRTRTYNPENAQKSGYFVIYSACMAFMTSDFERRCFNQYWFAAGDLAVTEQEWNNGIKTTAESIVGSNYNSGSRFTRNGVTYYRNAVSFYHYSDYDYALGRANVTFNSSGSACGLKDRYDFDPSNRSWLNEQIVALVNAYGAYYGAEEYDILYGVVE